MALRSQEIEGSKAKLTGAPERSAAKTGSEAGKPDKSPE